MQAARREAWNYESGPQGQKGWTALVYTVSFLAHDSIIMLTARYAIAIARLSVCHMVGSVKNS